MMNKQIISIIVAIDEKRGIGKNNELLFRIPEDFKRLKEKTTGHPIVMGRKTYNSIGRPLPNRTNIVISRMNTVHSEKGDIKQAITLEDALEIAKKSPGSDEIFIFGGGQIFKEALEKGFVDRLYITLVKGEYEADTFFPEYPEFTKVREQENKEFNEYKFTFLTLEK